MKNVNHSGDQKPQQNQPQDRKSIGLQIEEKERPKKIYGKLNDKKIEPEGAYL